MKKILGTLLLGLPLTLASCGGTSERVPDNAPPETTISGQVKTWSGSGTTSLLAGGATLSAAPVDTAGRFTLRLPETGPALSGQTRPLAESLEQGLRQLNCASAGLITSDPGAQGLLVFSLRAQDGVGTRDVVAANTSRTLTSRSIDARAWLYVDRSTTLGGTIDCRIEGLAAPVRLDVKAVPGWNMLKLTVYGNVGLGGLTVQGNVTRTLRALEPVQTWLTLDELGAALR